MPEKHAFQCPICPIVFDDEETANDHLEKHTIGQAFEKGLGNPKLGVKDVCHKYTKDDLTPCDATLEFIHDINNPQNENARAIAQCCLFKERHTKDGKRLKHLSLNVMATMDGTQFEGTDGWSPRIETVEQ